MRVHSQYIPHACGGDEDKVAPRSGMSGNSLCPPPKHGQGILVVTRSRFEQPYLDGFVAWYTRLGVECFLVFADDEMQLPLLPHSVHVLRSAKTGNELLKEFLAPVQRSAYRWALAIDVDEYLFLAPRFLSLKQYVANAERAYTGARIDAFQFPWVRVEMFQPHCSHDSISRTLQQRGLLYHSDAHVKTMSRISQVARFANPHSPVVQERENEWQLRSSVYTAGTLWHPRTGSLIRPPLNISASRALRSALAKGVWLPPFSPADPVSDQRKYADTALVHVQTRSLANMLIKAATTRLRNGNGNITKRIANISALGRLAVDAVQRGRGSELSGVLEPFAKAVGVKARLALSNLRVQDSAVNVTHLISAALRFNHGTNNDQPAMCNAQLEQAIFADVFAKEGLAPGQLWDLLQAVSEELVV